MFDRIKIIELPTLCDAYESSLHIVDLKNRIYHIFGKYDIEVQDDFILENYNRRHLQGALFLWEKE